MIGINELYLGDCLELMKQIEDKSIDMILTDIPYNEVNRKSNGLRKLDKGIADSSDFDIEKLCNEFNRICEGSIYIFCGSEQVSYLRNYFKLNDFSTRHCIWEKTNPSPMNGQHIWLSSIENCIYAKRKNATFNEHCKSSVWHFANGSSKIHPTEKPLKLFEYLISVSSNENDTILDPFIGSGTTAIACIKLNRNFIGIEKEPLYYTKAQMRIYDYKAQLKLL